MKASRLMKYGLAALLALGSIGTTACSEPNAPVEEDDSPVTLSAISDTTMLLGYGESKQISVRARFKDDGSPAEGRTVAFLINGAAKGSDLEETEVITDESGIATVNVKAGNEATVFSVVVSSGSSNQVMFNIDVNGKDIGSLRVYYSKPANTTVAFSKLVTKLHTDLFDCNNITDWSSLPEAKDQQISPNDSIPVVFGDLKAGDKFTVTVSAEGPEGNVIAHGCTISDPIVGRQITPATVNLTLLPATFTGTYQMVTSLHLPSMIPGGDSLKNDDGTVSAAYIVKMVLNFFDNPGDFLITTLQDLIDKNSGWYTAVSALEKGGVFAFETFYCPSHDGEATIKQNDETGEDVSDGDTEDAVWDYIPVKGTGTRYSCWCATHTGKCGSGTAMCGPKDHPEQQLACKDMNKADTAGKYLNMMISVYAPSWVSSIFTVGNSISTMIQDLVVGGEIEISKATETEDSNEENRKYTLEGKETWNSYMFTWKQGKNCSVSDPCCGQTVFGAGNADNNQLRAASAAFTGTATKTIVNQQDAYLLSIKPHPISIDYGYIIIYLLKNLAFPALTKKEAPVGMSDVINTLVPIENITCWVNEKISSIGGGGTSYDECMKTCKVTATRSSTTTYDWKSEGCNGTMADSIIQVFAKAGDWFDSKILSLSTNAKEEDQYKFMIGTNEKLAASNIISDTNYDLQIDRINLALNGYFYFGDAETVKADIDDGYMEAEFARVIVEDPNALDRTSCNSDAQCVQALGEDRTCQPRYGLVSRCQKRNVCAMKIGSYEGGAACDIDSQCKSGFCIPMAGQSHGICYSACDAEHQCTSSSTPVCNDGISYDFTISDISSGKETSYSSKLSSCMPN